MPWTGWVAAAAVLGLLAVAAVSRRDTCNPYDQPTCPPIDMHLKGPAL